MALSSARLRCSVVGAFHLLARTQRHQRLDRLDVPFVRRNMQRRAFLKILRLDVRVQRRQRLDRLRLTEGGGVEQRRRSYSIPRLLVRTERYKRLCRLHVPIL